MRVLFERIAALYSANRSLYGWGIAQKTIGNK